MGAIKVVVRESTGGKKKDVGMERVHRMIERDALTGLTVQELPDVAGISLKALRRRYRVVHGIEPSEHIRRIRLAKAKELLKSTNATMCEIASACGFASQAGFYNYFQRHEGMAPSEYRSREGGVRTFYRSGSWEVVALGWSAISCGCPLGRDRRKSGYGDPYVLPNEFWSWSAIVCRRGIRRGLSSFRRVCRRV